MKLLLTSAGITNNSIKSAMADLIDKKLKDCIISFIPTAGNVGNDDKDDEWEDEDIEGFRKTGAEVIMVDIEKLSKQEWLPILKKSDVICFGGGNLYHLLYWVKKSGLEKELKDLLESRLYIGVSAGSMITGPDVKINRDIFPEEESHRLDDLTGLKYVSFMIAPHFLSDWCSKLRHKEIKEFAKKVSYPIYAIDDNTAIKVINNKIEVVTEGK